MSALHWICALTLALVCCLSAQPVKREVDEKAQTKEEILDALKEIKKVLRDNCPYDTEIYSPDDIDEKCLSSALSCTISELNVIRKECDLEDDEGDFNVFDNLYSGLDKAKNETTPSPSTCKACEAYPTKNAVESLEDIKTLVERWGLSES